ncbi:adrenocorticotropic hormone receptor-like [Oculina patagonica]
MVDAFCHKKLQEFSAIVSHQQAFILFICVLNFLFSIVAILGNITVIHALWKASSIPANLKKLFLSLAFTDLAVGLFVQPMFAVILTVMLNMVTKENHDFEGFCPSIITSLMACSGFVVGTSFFTTAAIALDRYLALFLHLRYRELVTEKRVNISLAILWVASVLGTYIFMALPSHNEMAAVAYESAGLLVITVVYVRIYKVVRYHRNQIQNQCHIQNNETIEAAREKKSALNAFYVYIITLTCYLPNLVASILLEVDNTRMSTLVAYYFSIFFLFLNSSLNPLVYCWRYREVRNIVKNTVNKIFICNQTA